MDSVRIQAGVCPLQWMGVAGLSLENMSLQPAEWAGGTMPRGMAILALTVMKKGATVEALFKRKQQQNLLIRLCPGQYPVLSNCTAAEWLLWQSLGTVYLTSGGASLKVKLMRLCGSWRNEQWWAGEHRGAQLDGLNGFPWADPVGSVCSWVH